jgi:hypothetical protein
MVMKTAIAHIVHLFIAVLSQNNRPRENGSDNPFHVFPPQS